MDELLKYLSASGGVGVWILVYVAWKLESRIKVLEVRMESHNDHSRERHKRHDARLHNIEQRKNQNP